MAGNLTENFNELCRLCASKTNLIIGINIFEDEGSAREIIKKISACLPIQVHESDRLPKMICSDCVYKLDECFQFHEKCVNTENLFIEIVRKENDSQLEKIGESKNMDLDDQQIQIVQNPQELLDSNISLNELTNRENIMVNPQIILNTHNNIAMHNELDNIEITHGLTQQLNLHHESTMAQLPDMQISDAHLTLIHSQHNLITNYENIHNKSIRNDENSVGNEILTLKEQRNLVSVKIEEVKSESQSDLVLVKTTYSDATDSDDSSDQDFEPNSETVNCEVAKDDEGDELIDSNLYEQNHFLLAASEAEVGTSENTDTNQYYCNVCGKTISDKDEYLDHYGDHLSKCLICQEDFSTVDELKIHRKQIHQRSSKAEQSTSKSTRDRIKDKMKDPMDDNFFKEESSDDENSVTRENMSEFINENEEEDETEDNEDNNKNSKRKRWQPKVCSECGKSYKTNYKLAEHMRKHTGEQPFKCSMCDKAFRSKIGLAQHEAKHTGQYDFSCPTCGKGFQCKSYLIVHQRVHSNLKPFPCSQCGRNFKTKQSLLDHMNRHLGVKPYMCEICGRGFITKGLCKSHQKVHSGRDNRQYPCEVCNKLFVSKSYLATHLRIHTGEKPFMCEVCGKGFLTRVDLRIHSTMHTGEKSFVCEICGKAFARRDALRCHRRSHTGERPYRCDICGQTFTQFSPMAIHKRLHTGERPYACEVCNKTFVSRSTMMSHRKKHVP